MLKVAWIGKKFKEMQSSQMVANDVLLQVDAKNIFYNFGLIKLDEISISRNIKNI